MQASVLNAKNKEVAKAELSEDIFGGDVNEALLWEMVRMQMARRRQGTHATKTRAQVSASNKKPWNQKGTGRARVGSRVNPIWRGGGVAFGPSPRDYYYSMPKKKRRAAVENALAAKARDDELILVDSLELKEIKTKALVEVLNTLGVQNALIVISEADENIERSARNLPNVKAIRLAGLNVYDMLNHDKLILVGDVLDKIQGGL
jgi:large subunit ribosomal protein L4